MSYLERKNILEENETIVVKIEKNCLHLIIKWILNIALFIVSLIIPINVLNIILLIASIILAFKNIIATIQFCSIEYAVTNKKVVEKYGVLSIHCDQMDISKIENITTNITLLGRIFNYGDICLQGTNRNNVNFFNIKNAEQVRQAINDIRNKQ